MVTKVERAILSWTVIRTGSRDRLVIGLYLFLSLVVRDSLLLRTAIIIDSGELMGGD